MEDKTLQIESLAYGGAAIGHLENGKTVFVQGAAPGDTVLAKIVSDKGKYAEAEVLEVYEEGSARTQPACPWAAVCGGCSWQHIAYSAQLQAKRNAVVSSLVRIGKFSAETAENLVAPTQSSRRELGYRNKLELACTHNKQGRLTLGYHAAHSNDVVSVDSCPLVHKAIQGAPKAIQGALRYLEGSSNLGIFRVGVRHSMRTKACEIALWTEPGAFPRQAVAKTLASALHTTSIVRVIASPGSARKVKNVEVLSGNGYWEEDLAGFTMRVSAPSFFQVNTGQAEVLQNLVCEGLQVTENDSVADLYSGVGTFTLPLALRAEEVVAVESSGPAVRDLRRNADLAGVWVDVVGGDSAREIANLDAIDALVVDPPRAGLAEGVAESIASVGPRRVAYVSCDPATWARDAAKLCNCGYSLISATPVDLFPQTYHVETVSIFELS